MFWSVLNVSTQPRVYVLETQKKNPPKVTTSMHTYVSHFFTRTDMFTCLWHKFFDPSETTTIAYIPRLVIDSFSLTCSLHRVSEVVHAWLFLLMCQNKLDQIWYMTGFFLIEQRQSNPNARITLWAKKLHCWNLKKPSVALKRYYSTFVMNDTSPIVWYCHGFIQNPYESPILPVQV